MKVDRGAIDAGGGGAVAWHERAQFSTASSRSTTSATWPSASRFSTGCCTNGCATSFRIPAGSWPARWYADFGLKYYRDHPELVRFDLAHRELHRIARLLQETVKCGQGDRGELLAAFMQAARSLQDRLEASQCLEAHG